MEKELTENQIDDILEIIHYFYHIGALDGAAGIIEKNFGIKYEKRLMEFAKNLQDTDTIHKQLATKARLIIEQNHNNHPE